jgi:DNA-binding XRE family transcriptional regulator
MDKYEVNELPELDRNKLIEILTDELPVLRAKLGISQDDISNIVGISRQTYSAIETKKRKMSWNTFLSLILFYGYNEKTTNLVEAIGAFPPELKQTLNINRRMREDK